MSRTHKDNTMRFRRLEALKHPEEFVHNHEHFTDTNVVEEPVYVDGVLIENKIFSRHEAREQKVFEEYLDGMSIPYHRDKMLRFADSHFEEHTIIRPFLYVNAEYSTLRVPANRCTAGEQLRLDSHLYDVYYTEAGEIAPCHPADFPGVKVDSHPEGHRETELRSRARENLRELAKIHRGGGLLDDDFDDKLEESKDK